jgi:uncharacterized protein involved in exopolysaccharide biosynthesis
MAELALEQTLDLGDYLSAFKRRRGMVLLIAGTVLVLGLITAFVLPPTYQSASTILIEEQEIPAELVQSTVTSYAAQRIQVISQRVMTRSNLIEILNKYNLYESERKRKGMDEVLANMRQDIGIDMITAEVIDPRTGRPTAATIAFNVGFKGEDPELVQKVASELTTLYLNENLKTRTKKAQETTDFLTVEASRLSEEISRLESELAAFKEQHVNELPELRNLNTQAMERTEREIANIDIQLGGLEERKIYLQGQLALIDPYISTTAVLSPAERLDALRTEYIRLSSRYSPDHPDVTGVKREIKALEKETGLAESATEKRARLQVLEQELSVAEKTYTDEHPDVKRLRREIAYLEEDLRNPQPATATATTKSNVGADNPAFVNLQSQLDAAVVKERSLREQRSRLTEKLQDYERRLMQTPRVEQEYRSIVRDLENTTSRYQNLKAKQSTAEVAQELEKERKGEKFTLIDPAVTPQEPISPNRPAIIFLSLVLALGAGVGSAAVTESLDSTVRGTKGLIAALNTAPLAVIPYLANETDIRKGKNRKRVLYISVVAGIVVILLLIHFLVSPLDVLWFKALRKADNLVGG